MVAFIASGQSPRQQEKWGDEEGGRQCHWLLMHSKQDDETHGIPNATPCSLKKEHIFLTLSLKLPASLFFPLSPHCCTVWLPLWHSKTF